MRFRNVGVATATAIMMLAAGCSAGSGSNTAPLNVEKTDIVVDAFPAIDSAGLYIAQMNGLFADQGLHVTIEPTPRIQTMTGSRDHGPYRTSALAVPGHRAPGHRAGCLPAAGTIAGWPYRSGVPGGARGKARKGGSSCPW